MKNILSKFAPVDLILVIVIIVTAGLIALGVDSEIKTIFKASIGIGLFKKFILKEN